MHTRARADEVSSKPAQLLGHVGRSKFASPIAAKLILPIQAPALRPSPALAPRPAPARTAIQARPAWSRQGATGGSLKRAVDLLIASSVLVLLSPLLVLVALGVWLTAGGPILYSQRRVGFAGRPFQCFKFRTMTVDADRVLRRHLASNPAAAREWAETQKLKQDPRVTPLGRLLRRTSIDELPQLFNVLGGDMSCIGPRPVLFSELERYQEYANDYLTARPGLTGLWQVSGRNRLSYRNRVQLDRYYVRRWSLLLDSWILLRTASALLRWDETS